MKNLLSLCAVLIFTLGANLTIADEQASSSPASQPTTPIDPDDELLESND